MSKRSAILNAATRAFASKGFRETSTTDLAQMTGVAEGTVFYHFGSKENLFLAVLDHVRQEFQREFAGYLETTDASSGLQKVEEAAGFFLQLATDREELFLLLHRPDAYELARVNERCRRELEAIFECLVGVFEGALVEGRKDGSVEVAAAHSMALLIFTMVDGLVRLRDCSLYEPGAVFPDLMSACRKLVASAHSEE
ncbi:MAG: TetR/AcrR family transcriptional regulator [Candidatus Sulfomarinibacteraceae bacterium]